MQFIITGYSSKANGFCCVVTGDTQKEALLNLPNTPAARRAILNLLVNADDAIGIVRYEKIDNQDVILLTRVGDTDVSWDDGPRWCYQLFISELRTDGEDMPDVVCW